MAAISTSANAIDRKLHRVILEADPDQFMSFAALSRQIAKSKLQEFSYHRLGKAEYAGAEAIEQYVSFSREIGLLDGDLGVTRPKKDVRGLENFQQWLSDLTVQYLDSKNASLKQVEQAIKNLVQDSPSRLPTQENIRTQLDNPPPLRPFRFCLRIIALLRPETVRLISRRVVVMDGIVEG